METRIVRAHELRSVKTNAGLQLSGYAARYNVLSHPIPAGNGMTFRERISKRAFDGVLRSAPDTVALINHNPNLILGRTGAKTLRLNGDDTGLRFEVDLPNTSYARDLHETVNRGDAAGMSFAFGTLEQGDEEWNEEEDETRSRVAVRTVKNFRKLIDISVITGASPAYPGTDVSARHELVAAECRSFVERLSAPKPMKPSRAEIERLANKLLRAFERIEKMPRRNRMLRDILD
jgi:HK97 family phage prohead protease